ncbi:hypothetical protein J3R30DRAFT_3881162 [Lentinula aciculospora]|uniref:Uncharacterized protein n=1 Tax=Lentinula aciculospora TaxID=153920 RepID=A0A9W9DNW9_9AGAR|nr:hypothetical protein J3R30DRAFT_3881162 [Lentinula aciculospora]
MHYSQLLTVLLSAVATLHVAASPIPEASNATESGAPGLERRAPIELYHVTTSAAATAIQHSGVKLQVKPTIGDDFNPKGAGGFYASDDKQGILNWCKSRQVDPANVKTNCAELITFKLDASAMTSLKVHKFTGPAGKSGINAWMSTPDFEQWSEFTALCTHGEQNDEDVKLAADLANGGSTLDLVIGPMVNTETLRQYAFRTTKALGHLTVESVTKSGL